MNALREFADELQPEIWHSARSLGFDRRDAPMSAAQSASFRRAVASLRDRGYIETRYVELAHVQLANSARYAAGSAGPRERLMLRVRLSYDDLLSTVREWRKAEEIRRRLSMPGVPLVGTDREFLTWHEKRYALPEGRYLDERELRLAMRNFPSTISRPVPDGIGSGVPYLD